MTYLISELWPGGPLFNDGENLFPIVADSVLLAYFANNTRLKPKKRAADLGCGSGVISVLLAMNDPMLTVDSIEIQHSAAVLAIENAESSGTSGRLAVIECDLRRHRDLLQAGAYDLAISNPPYFAQGSGKRPADSAIEAARAEGSCTLDDICKAAGYLTRYGGAFFLVHKPERLTSVFRSLSGAGFEPKRVRFVQHTYSSPPSLVLIESRRGGKPSLDVQAPLILFNANGSDTDEAKAIYRRK